jgi:RNA polymerase sigma factor (sigma-70 family)
MGTAMTTDTEQVNNDLSGTLAGKVGDAVVRHRAGDDRAMADLVRSVTPWLFRVCRDFRLSTATAEDVVQNTLLAFVQHGGTVRDPRSALSWLTVVARRESLRALNKERRAEPVGDVTAWDTAREARGGASSEALDPQAVVEDRMAREVLLANLARLPDRKRELLSLMFLNEVTAYATISEILDMPVGSIGPTRQRGLDTLRGLLAADRRWTQRRPA